MSKAQIPKTTKSLNGFIYPLIDKFFIFINNHLIIVEYFKKFAVVICQRRNDKSLELVYCRIAVDFYILMKWAIVAVFWLTNSRGSFFIAIIWYLLLSNLFSYFYNHIWDKNLFQDKNFDIDRLKRRFMNIMLAILFSIFGFAFLYAIPYFYYFSWSENSAVFINSIFYSLANSLTMNYELVKPISDIGHFISVIQLAMMFIFLSVLLAGSIPQFNTINKGDKNGL